MLAGPAFFVMLFVVLYPILQALYDSLFTYRLTAPGEREFVGLGNYGVILSDPVFWRDLGITLLITLVTVVVELILGFLLALAMHHAITSTRGLIRTMILVPYGIITVCPPSRGSTCSPSTPASSTTGSTGCRGSART